jgi:hypothetical protein
MQEQQLPFASSCPGLPLLHACEPSSLPTSWYCINVETGAFLIVARMALILPWANPRCVARMGPMLAVHMCQGAPRKC